MTKIKKDSKPRAERVLIQFSGLAWNLKTTIVDDICKCSPRFVRLCQTNKSAQDKDKTPGPRDLQVRFLTQNKELIEGTSDIITDRALIDYDIYDVMMNPIHMHRLYDIRSSEAFNSHWVDRYSYHSDFYRKFTKVITVSLQTSNRKFIISTFRKQPESSTAYLFDNPNKYTYYSNFFNELSDHIHNKLVSMVKQPYGIEFRRLFFKFTESDTPEEFIARVRLGVINEVTNSKLHV